LNFIWYWFISSNRKDNGTRPLSTVHIKGVNLYMTNPFPWLVLEDCFSQIIQVWAVNLFTLTFYISTVILHLSFYKSKYVLTYFIFFIKLKNWETPINQLYAFYMSHAPPYSKTGHMLLYASNTCRVPIPCGVQSAGNNKLNIKCFHLDQMTNEV